MWYGYPYEALSPRLQSIAKWAIIGGVVGLLAGLAVEIAPVTLAVLAAAAGAGMSYLAAADSPEPASESNCRHLLSGTAHELKQDVGTSPDLDPQNCLVEAALHQGHTNRINEERKDKGPPQVGG